jgi:hypothetical protein
MATTPAGKPADATSEAGQVDAAKDFPSRRGARRRLAEARVINSPGGQARGPGAYGNVIDLSPTVTVVLQFVAERPQAKARKTTAWQFLPIF